MHDDQLSYHCGHIAGRSISSETCEAQEWRLRNMARSEHCGRESGREEYTIALSPMEFAQVEGDSRHHCHSQPTRRSKSEKGVNSGDGTRKYWSLCIREAHKFLGHRASYSCCTENMNVLSSDIL